MSIYRPFLKAVAKYWRQYGGIRAVAISPYFHIALVLSLVNFFANFWGRWWEHSFQLLPSLIGLTLAGYAVMLSVVSGDMLKILSKRKQSRILSNFEIFNTTFFHFVFVQTISLLLASLGEVVNTFSFLGWFSGNANVPVPNAWLVVSEAIRQAYNFVGLLFLHYSITLILATLIGIYRIANVMQIVGEQAAKGDEDQRKSGS